MRAGGVSLRHAVVACAFLGAACGGRSEALVARPADAGAGRASDGALVGLRAQAEGGIGDGASAVLDSEGTGEEAAEAALDGSAGTVGGDRAFGVEGLVVGNLDWIPAGVAVQPDGKIVVAGASNDGRSPPAELVRRFTESGLPDPAFGSASQATVAGQPGPLPQSVAVLGNGSIGLFGAAILASGAGVFATRLDADGVAPSSPLLSTAVGRGVQGLWSADGSVIAIGSDAIERVKADGTFDQGFAPSSSLPGALAAALSSGGFLTARVDGVRRYHADGTVDIGFGVAGKVATTFPPRALFVRSDGSVLIAGGSAADAGSAVHVARVSADGTLDRAFVSAGASTQSAESVLGIAELPDARVAVWTDDGYVILLEPDGSADRSASSDGVVDLSVLGTVYAGVVDVQGRLLVVGLASDPRQPVWFLRRYVL
jgi:uncharacterized delta-60 repeat protein